MSEVVQLRPKALTLCSEAERVLSNMLFKLATGWLPWGHKPVSQMNPCRSGDQWIMCCGNVLTADEGAAAFDMGLVAHGKPDQFGRPTMQITPAGEMWLASHWPQPPYATGRED